MSSCRTTCSGSRGVGEPSGGVMETQYYSFDIGDESADEPHKRRGKKSREEESDTAKIFGDSIFTPKPRMDFNLNNLEFGPNYHQDTDKE